MSEPVRPASPRQVLLGLFILVQIVYLLFTNIITYIKWLPTELATDTFAPTDAALPHFAKRSGHAYDWSEEIETAIRRYAQLTGQDQQWGLFAPVGKATGFPVVLMLRDAPGPAPGIDGATLTFDAKNGFHLVGDWDPKAVDSPRESGSNPLKLILSSNEPADISSFIRLGNCRLRKYDGSVYVYTMPRKDDTEADLAERLNSRTSDLLRDYHDLTLTYLRWKVRAWQKEQPGWREEEKAPSMPKQVILLQRCYRIHDPGEPTGWDGPFIVPIGRWQPNSEPNAAQALESYDFNTHRFVPVR